MDHVNQTPEQKARDNIDRMLEAAGWVVQDKKRIDFNAGPGVAVREYLTDIGPADYVLFVDRQPAGIIEAKKEEAYALSSAETQAKGVKPKRKQRGKPKRNPGRKLPARNPKTNKESFHYEYL
ncbi:MAG: hypothetical protein OXI53_10835 [Nitrospira sp.]|nr:hypothetical protein [Nitrospira sp.]MDE0405793.1 hypothetical protein [Nitrospira sp.]